MYIGYENSMYVSHIRIMGMVHKDWFLKQTANFFLVIKLSLSFYILHILIIYRWFNVTNIIPHSPEDGLLELKHNSVDIYIYIYIYI